MIKKKITIEDTKSEEKTEEIKDKPKKKEPKLQKPYIPIYEVKAEGDDARNFDFAANRPSENSTTFAESLTHLVSNSFGALIVSLNELYVRNGIIGSLLANVFLSCIMTYCLYSITKSAHKVYGITQVSQMTYPDLAQATLDICSFPALKKLGGKFKSVVIGFIVARYIAKCCIFQIIMARCFPHLLVKTDQTDMIRINLAIVLIPILLICMLRSTEYIAPFNYLTRVFTLMTCLYVIACMGFLKGPNSFTSYPIVSNGSSLFRLIGGCAFAMDTSSAILTIENDMEEPKRIYHIIMIGMAIITVLTMAMSAIGAYAWGYDTKAPIIVNFGSVPYVRYFKVGIFFVTYLSFSIDFWVFFNLLWIHIKKIHQEKQYWIFERLYRAAFVLAITFAALAFPDVSGLLSFFGALTVGILNFIFPPVIEFLIDVRHDDFGRFKWKVVRLVAIASFGIVIVIGGTISGVLNIVGL